MTDKAHGGLGRYQSHTRWSADLQHLEAYKWWCRDCEQWVESCVEHNTLHEHRDSQATGGKP